MFDTGINPLDGKPVYVATDYHEKQLQRALLQFNKPQNADLVREALRKLGREDLIGDERYATREARIANSKELYELFVEAYKTKTCDE